MFFYLTLTILSFRALAIIACPQSNGCLNTTSRLGSPAISSLLDPEFMKGGNVAANAASTLLPYSTSMDRVSHLSPSCCTPKPTLGSSTKQTKQSPIPSRIPIAPGVVVLSSTSTESALSLDASTPVAITQSGTVMTRLADNSNTLHLLHGSAAIIDISANLISRPTDQPDNSSPTDSVLPLLTIAGNTYAPQSTSDYLLGSHTLIPGGQTTTASNVPTLATAATAYLNPGATTIARSSRTGGYIWSGTGGSLSNSRPTASTGTYNTTETGNATETGVVPFTGSAGEATKVTELWCFGAIFIAAVVVSL